MSERKPDVEMFDCTTCSSCNADMGRLAFQQGLGAGEQIECCGITYEIEEHGDGWLEWFSFRRIGEPARG